MKFLVVEDVTIIRRSLSRYLEPYGEVDMATDGLDALGKFCFAHSANNPYDLMLLDIMLPKLNGIQMLTKVREIEREILITDVRNQFDPVKIIMVSSLSDRKAVGTAIEMGCNGYITKPFDKNRIIAELIKVGMTLDKK